MLDAVVIGTGFGGAVAACRLAQAGLRVCVLERGRRYPKGGFPRDWRRLDAGWLWSAGRGLYDVKPINLYPDDGSGAPPRLRYAMPFLGSDGQAYVLDGAADVTGLHGEIDPTATQVVYTTLRRGLDGGGPVVSNGIVRLGVLALLAELSSLRLTGTGTAAAQADAALRFLEAFVGPIALTLLPKEI